MARTPWLQSCSIPLGVILKPPVLDSIALSRLYFSLFLLCFPIGISWKGAVLFSLLPWVSLKCKCRQRSSSLGLYSIEHGNKEACKKLRQRFYLNYSNRTKGNGFKLKKDTFRLDMRKKFFHSEGGEAQAQFAQRNWLSHPWKNSRSSCQGLWAMWTS